MQIPGNNLEPSQPKSRPKHEGLASAEYAASLNFYFLIRVLCNPN